MKTQKYGFPNVFQLASYILLGFLIFTQFYIILPSQTKTQQIVYSIVSSIILFSLVLSFFLTQLVDSLDETIKQYYLSTTQGKPFDITKYNDYCDNCDSFVKSSSKHCKKCNRCSSGFDHHCKWLNKCIGEHNYKYFFCLIVSVSLLLVVLLIQYIQFIVQYHINSIQSSSGKIAVVYISTVLGLIVFTLDFNLVLFHVWIKFHHLTTYGYILKCREQAKMKIELEQMQRKSLEARMAIEGEPSINATKIKGQDDDQEGVSKDQSKSDQDSGRVGGGEATPNQEFKPKTQGSQLKEDSIKIQTSLQQPPQSLRSTKSVKIQSKNTPKSPGALEPYLTLPKFLRMNLAFEDMNLENIIDPSVKGDQSSSNRMSINNPPRKISYQSAVPPSGQRRQANIQIFQQQCISKTVPISDQTKTINEQLQILNIKQQPDFQKYQQNISPIKEQTSRLGFQSSLEHSQIGIGSQLYDSQMVQLKLKQGTKKSLIETATTTSINTPRKVLIIKADKNIKSSQKGSTCDNYLETNVAQRENNLKDEAKPIELVNIVNLDQSSLPLNLINFNDASILETEQFNIPPKINEKSS